MNHKQIALGEKNREAVRRWFIEHLCGTQEECARDLGLSPMAVSRHAREIRGGWRGKAKSHSSPSSTGAAGSSSLTSTSEARGTGLGEQQSSAGHTLPPRRPVVAAALDVRMIVVAAFRYYLGRRTISVWAFAGWLCQQWDSLDGGTRTIISREIEEAFSDDDAQRAKGDAYRRLGDDCDRASWARVRAMYRTPTCCLCGRELPSDVPQSIHLDGEHSCDDCAPPGCYVCGGEFEIGEQIVPDKVRRRSRHPYKCKEEPSAVER